MKFRTRTIGLLAGTMGVALAGLIFLQYLLLKDAAELKEQAFRQNVAAAMHAVAQKLQTQEAVANAFRVQNVVTTGPHGQGKQIIVKVDAHGSSDPRSDSLPRIHVLSTPLRFEGDQIHYSVPEPQHVMLRLFNAIGRQDTVLVDTFQQAGEYAIHIDRKRFREGSFFCKFGTEHSSFVMRMSYEGNASMVSNFTTSEERQALVGSVLDNLVVNEAEPIERRIDPALLDSVVRSSIREAGLTMPFGYGVLNEHTDSLRLVQPAGMNDQVRQSEFKAPLFPFDFLSSKTQLILYFPDQKLFLLKAIGPLLALTILFMGIIIICFAATLRMIVRQQQFSERLADFINNMTHEFKTPVSTIAVAAETIARPEILTQPEKLLRYGSVIHDENTRMKNHIDRILQMAVLEEGEYELKRVPVDVHEILGKAIEPLHLRVEARQGVIHCRFNAAHHGILADPVHLTNIFHNVLDNANKYSPDKPAITIETWNTDQTISVRISDQGIGIGRDERKKVFEKYYRVPTGNIHNVKGFGLGLSYVKLMADAHGASIEMESEPGKGTAVTLTFPLATENAASL